MQDASDCEEMSRCTMKFTLEIESTREYLYSRLSLHREIADIIKDVNACRELSSCKVSISPSSQASLPNQPQAEIPSPASTCASTCDFCGRFQHISGIIVLNRPYGCCQDCYDAYKREQKTALNAALEGVSAKWVLKLGIKQSTNIDATPVPLKYDRAKDAKLGS